MKFKLSGSGVLAHSVAIVTALHAVGAFAAEEVEEIVVMAQRRAESIQDVPLAVSAFTGTFVRDTHLDDIKDLVKFTPGITGNSKDSFIDTLSIRGIVTNDFGVGGDPSVGVFKNNLYQGRNGEVVTTLYDIERAEVLRGPQGFLFGRNSIARRDQRVHEAAGIRRQSTATSLSTLASAARALKVHQPAGERNVAFRVAGFHNRTKTAT